MARRPRLLTYDLFGTVIDWRRGLKEAIRGASSRIVSDVEFDRLIDVQGELEQRGFRPYREIVAESLVSVLELDRGAAERIGRDAGTWPLYPDSREGLGQLMDIAPCVAMTNSDLAHRPQIEAQLGFALSGWFCAEEVRCYKPARAFWEKTAAGLGISFSRDWWHVSAYGDYDLEQVASLDLTGVFVERPHARPGPHEIRVASLVELAEIADVTWPA